MGRTPILHLDHQWVCKVHTRYELQLLTKKKREMYSCLCTSVTFLWCQFCCSRHRMSWKKEKKKKEKLKRSHEKTLKELNSEQKCVFVFFILPTSLVWLSWALTMRNWIVTILHIIYCAVLIKKHLKGPECLSLFSMETSLVHAQDCICSLVFPPHVCLSKTLSKYIADHGVRSRLSYIVNLTAYCLLISERREESVRVGGWGWGLGRCSDWLQK